MHRPIACMESRRTAAEKSRVAAYNYKKYLYPYIRKNDEYSFGSLALLVRR